ncbi:Lysine-specific demethylase [Lachnellula hyalina]|uniref:Lysine-specific demethylase n=1 Tax=Lachnellula hyalina TaxID=1316788 RepID=A0A8H8R174_9HELO|nr:Lysine-specific demethylase [Lachnellula hyalina]TVY25024.1 Lysine-specific demethylase [Lachnellula hyalina]
MGILVLLPQNPLSYPGPAKRFRSSADTYTRYTRIGIVERTTTHFTKALRSIHHHAASIISNAPQIDTLYCDTDNVPLEQFRQRAFVPEKPIRIIQDRDSPRKKTAQSLLPAQQKWFSQASSLIQPGIPSPPGANLVVPSQEYLSQFADTILPYEFILPQNPNPNYPPQPPKIGNAQDEVSQVIASLLAHSPDATFHRFNAPLSLFLHAYKTSLCPRDRLYIAQAQIADLPAQMRDDLPVPRIVREAGRGDVYDANVWMGIPPTYTPLHKDPNPNLFVQLAGWKRVRLFTPGIGVGIFRSVQGKIGRRAEGVFRGEEMMEGPERDVLDEDVWSANARMEGFEVDVGPGEALFIPKGWWHSIKSVGPAVTASVNWWFR